MENSSEEQIEKLEQEIGILTTAIQKVSKQMDMLIFAPHQSDVSEEDMKEELLTLEGRLEKIWNENRAIKQRLISHTVSLMHQRRKAANHVDDQYFEQEIYIQSHEEIEEVLNIQRGIVAKHKTLLEEED